MLTRRLIACLDVRSGRVVKGVQFAGDGDAFSGSKVSTPEDFDIEEGAGAEDLA